VVSTPLKNVSQLALLFPIYGKIKAMFQTANQTTMVSVDFPTTNPVQKRPRHVAGSSGGTPPKGHQRSKAAHWRRFLPWNP